MEWHMVAVSPQKQIVRSSIQWMPAIWPIRLPVAHQPISCNNYISRSNESFHNHQILWLHSALRELEFVRTSQLNVICVETGHTTHNSNTSIAHPARARALIRIAFTLFISFGDCRNKKKHLDIKPWLLLYQSIPHTLVARRNESIWKLSNKISFEWENANRRGTHKHTHNAIIAVCNQ